MQSSRALLAGVAFAILAAGCSSPSMGPVGGESPPEGRWAFAAPVVALEECHYASCYEPSIAADPQGRLFVVDGSASAVAVSEDGGSTWDQRLQPPMPMGLEGTQSDVIVQVSPTGRLYWSALVVARPPQPIGLSGPFLEGIQVAWSDDGAKTWIGDVHVAPVAGAPQVLYPDRQWLGFAPDGTVYLTYNQIPTGIWLARSDDEGKTWSAWTRAAAVEGREGGLGQSGPPVVTLDGTLIVPACQGPAVTEGAPGTYMFRSEDHGATFEPILIDAPCSWFPIATIAPDGRVILGDQPDGVQVTWSDDDGRSYDGPVQWGNGATTAGVWPVVGADGTVFVAWFNGAGQLHLTRGNLPGGPAETLDAGKATGEGSARTTARTDFASAALLPDGRVAVVWTEGNQAKVALTSA
ncbi:MAG: sialidase family protein [Thermoplasmatota archaeon]